MSPFETLKPDIGISSLAMKVLGGIFFNISCFVYIENLFIVATFLN